MDRPIENSLASSTDFGSVELGRTAIQGFTIGNATLDPNGGNHTLTDLTLLSYKFTGANAADFSLSGFTPGEVLGKGITDDFTLAFNPTKMSAHTRRP